MMENISVKDKIKVFEEKIKAKKEELANLKRNVHIDQVYVGEGVEINEESKEEDNNEIEQDNYADSL